MPEVVIPGLSEEDVVSVANGARTYSQFLDMVDKAQKGVCPFCPAHFDPVKNKVLKRAGGWRMWHNPYPAKHTKVHYVIAPDKHVLHPQHLTAEDWDDQSVLIDFVTNGELGLGVLGGCIATRFGDPRLNAGSIRHLHTNIIVPDGTGDVQVTLCKSPEKQQQVRIRLIAFEVLRLAGISGHEASREAPKLLSGYELSLVSDRLI